MIAREVELADESHPRPRQRMHIHHINDNHDDNGSSNLVRLTSSEHGMIHGIADHVDYKDPVNEVKAVLAEALIPTLQEPAAKHYSRPHVKTIRISSFFLRSFLLRRHTSSTLSRATRNECFQLLRASWLNR
jgi:hypothetical protein